MERRRVEAMQRRKKRRARNSLPCALSCLKSNIHAEVGGGAPQKRCWLLSCALFRASSWQFITADLSEDTVFADKKSQAAGPAE